MYSYYALTAYGKRPPKWVSMFVTTVQTLQMFAGVAVSLMVYKWKVYNNMRFILLLNSIRGCLTEKLRRKNIKSI